MMIENEIRRRATARYEGQIREKVEQAFKPIFDLMPRKDNSSVFVRLKDAREWLISDLLREKADEAVVETIDRMMSPVHASEVAEKHIGKRTRAARQRPRTKTKRT